MSGRAFLAFGIFTLATLAAVPARACGTDDRFACASTASSDTKSTQTAATSTASKSQRGAKIRVQKKRVAAEKKAKRNAARARIIQASRSKTDRSSASARVEESAPVESTRRETTARTETAKRMELRVPAEPLAAKEPPSRIGTFAPAEAPSLNERSAVPAPRYEIASAGSSPLVAVPASPASELFSPVPTAGAPEIIRLAAPSEVAEPEQITNSAPILAASEVPAPTVEFKSDPARLFTTPVVAERPSPRKNAPNGLSWMQAVFLALGGGIVAISTFKLFSSSKAAA